MFHVGRGLKSDYNGLKTGVSTKHDRDHGQRRAANFPSRTDDPGFNPATGAGPGARGGRVGPPDCEATVLAGDGFAHGCAARNRSVRGWRVRGLKTPRARSATKRKRQGSTLSVLDSSSRLARLHELSNPALREVRAVESVNDQLQQVRAYRVVHLGSTGINEFLESLCTGEFGQAVLNAGVPFHEPVLPGSDNDSLIFRTLKGSEVHRRKHAIFVWFGRNDPEVA